MVSKQDVIVGGDGAELGEALLNTQEGSMYVQYRHIENPLDERGSELAVNDNKQNTSARFPRNNEISLGISAPRTGVDMLGSFVDEGSV